MDDKSAAEISKKLNVLISLSMRQLTGDQEFGKRSGRKQGAGVQARYLADLGLTTKDIAEILGAPLQSVRTLLTPHRRR